MGKPWVDVGTTAIARLLTKASMESFLNCMEDRDQFRLRWLYHLDTYPYPELKKHFDATMAQAIETAHLFDDAVLTASYTHQGLGGALYIILRNLQHDWLCIEDDFQWYKPFRLADIIAKPHDYYSFRGACLGSTAPSFWRHSMAKFLFDHYPKIPQHVTGRCRIGIIQDANRFTMTPADRSKRTEYCRSLGWRRLVKLKAPRFGTARNYIDVNTGICKHVRSCEHALRVAQGEPDGD